MLIGVELEEQLIAARQRMVLAAPLLEQSKCSEIGLRKFIAVLPRGLEARTSVALSAEGRFTLRLTHIGEWLCLLRFDDEMHCGFQYNGEFNGQRCWLKGEGPILYAVRAGMMFGISVGVE